jgi:hypothetical protein
MLRVIATIVLPLVLPSALYLLWVAALRRAPEQRIDWRAAPWIWLVGIGLGLAAGVLAFVHIGFGTQEGGRYVPAHVENGKLVPGRFEPAAGSR